MGDAQSAQREGKKDAAAEEESGKVDDAQQNIEDKPLTNNGLISEINGKADGSLEEVNGHCEDEIAAEATLSPDEDVSETEKPRKEEVTPIKNVEINEKESPSEANVNEDVPLEMIEMDAKQNDINESFRRFFGNIGLKLTVKRGSGEIATDVSDKSNKEEPNRPEDVEDTAKETTSENAENTTEVNMAQETYDNDSTTCPTLTDVTSEDVLENAGEKTTETKEKVESDNADAATTSPVVETAHQDAPPEKEPHSTSVYSPEEEVVDSPIKRFFTTGIFSGLRKKKKPAEVETTDKELTDMAKKEVIETAEQTEQDQDKEEISLGIEAAADEIGNENKGEIVAAESAQKPDSSTIDPSTIIVSGPEILNSQEREKVQASPLKRLLSGSSFKKLSKKQRGRKSSDARLSDSGEHVSDQLQSSNESAENQKEEGCALPSAEAPGEEESAWVSFKKLLTPKKRMKRPSLGNEETQIPGSVEEPKPSEEGQISDQSMEEGKKRKDSSVSWEAVLCGSGRRRSRKTSDSEDETPQIDNDTNKQDGGSKNGAESAIESSNEADEIIAYSPKRAESPSESDGGSTWKSLKRLVTPKRKARDEDESKDNVPSDTEITQDESSFSIKKLLPGRKKRKSAEKHDQVSSDEADKDVASGDEDSETPAVVPLSEFDTVETEVHIQTQADVESHIPKEADYEFHQDLLDQNVEPVLPGDSLQTETKKAQDNEEVLENKASITPSANEEPDDSTESISKPQLSDIPEEATPASFTEEAARDDTIAEDLIEITSEAITAPEPLDTTMADETEMISAVSQLSSESSKTSGNTTPVPAEYDVQETDALLHKVAETISISPKAVRASSDELQSERIIVSDSPQTLETFVKEQQPVLEVHEVASTTQTESNDSVSTEIISEVPTEEFDTAEIAADEVHELDVTQPEESLKELESIDESHNLVECLFEVNADILPEGDQIAPADGSSAEAHQTETDAPKMDSQEAESVATAEDETKDEPVEQEVQSLTEKEAQNMHHMTDQTNVKDKDQPPIEVAVQAATLHLKEGSVQLLEKDVISEDVPAANTDTYDFKEETVSPTEVNVEPEKVDKQVTDADTHESKKVPEAFEDLQTSTLDLEEGAADNTVCEQVLETSEDMQISALDSAEGAVQSPKDEVKSEDFPPAETVTEDSKQTAEEIQPLTEDNPEPVDNTKTELAEESEVTETSQAPLLDTEQGSVQSPEKEATSEDVPEAETITNKPKEETILPTEVSLEQADSLKTEQVQQPELVEIAQRPLLDSEEGSVQSPEKEAVSEDVPEAEALINEPKEESILPSEVGLEPADSFKTEHVQEPEVVEIAQTPLSVTEEGSIQLPEKEAISEDVPAAETLTSEPKEETILPTEVSLEPADSFKTEHIQEPEVLEAPQAPSLDSLECSVQSLEKETISEDILEAETVTGEPKEETKPLSEDNLELLDTSKTEHVQEPKVLQTVQAPTLDFEANSLLDKKVLSDGIPEVETVSEKPKQETDGKQEEQKTVEASKTEHVYKPEVLEAVLEAPTSDLEKGRVESLEKEVIAEDVPEVETVTHEAGKETTEVNLEPMEASKDIPAAATVTEKTKQETDVKSEERQPAEASKTEQVQVPEALEAVEATTPDFKESIAESLEKEITAENFAEVETVTDEARKESIPPTEVNLEPVDASKDISAVETVTEEPKQDSDVKLEEQQPVEASKTEHVQEVLEAVQAPVLDLEEDIFKSLEKEEISEDVPEVETETVTDEAGKETIPSTAINLEPVDTSKDIPAVETEEPKQKSKVEPEENLPVEASKTEHVQEPEVVQSGLKDIVTDIKTDEGTSTYDHIVTESLKGGSAQQISFEDIHKPDVKSVIASATDGIKKEVVAQLDQSLEITEDQKTGRIPEVGVEQDESILDVVDQLQALTAVCVPSVNEDAPIVQVLEKPVLTEKPPAPCVDHAEVTNEPGHKVHLSAVQASVEVEKEIELPGKEMQTAALEHAVVAQVVTCNLKDIAAVIPDVLIKKTSTITEPLIDIMASGQVFQEKVESAMPLMKDDIAETAEASSLVVTMHVPSVEDNHRIQVQGVDVDVKSAETTVDTVLQAEVTEDKEVIDVCHETSKKVDNLSATAEIEDELINDENKVIIQEVIQHVKENITVPESVVVNLEQKGIKQTYAVTEASEMIENESTEVDDQKVMEDNTSTIKEIPDIAKSSDVSSHDHKEDLEEPKASQEKSVAVVTTEDLDVKIIKEEVQIPPIAQSPAVTQSNTDIVAIQNTGTISSAGNVEAPSSLSFEFKFNIQFGQAKGTASPPCTTEKTESVKKTDVSEVGVQADSSGVEASRVELTELTVQATEITEPDTTLDSTETAVIMTQPVLLDGGIQDMENVESVEQMKSTERATSSVQASEIIQPVIPTENREVISSQPVLSQCCDQETKTEEPVKQKEEENDQDVWMDAEEDISTQEEKQVSHHGVKEHQAESEQEEKAGLEHEIEMAASSKPEDENSQAEMSKSAVTCENDSDGEDFAVALEDLEITTASVSTVE